MIAVKLNMEVTVGLFASSVTNIIVLNIKKDLNTSNTMSHLIVDYFIEINLFKTFVSFF